MKIYRILKSFDKIYSEFTDAEKKRFIGSFVERVEIYEEEQENGRFLKSIKFRFPVYYNGTETQEVDLSDFSWDYQRSLETVCLLFKLVIMPGRPQLSFIVSKTHAPAQTMMNASMQTFMGFRFPVITLYLE